jgi:hypothetical protein
MGKVNYKKPIFFKIWWRIFNGIIEDYGKLYKKNYQGVYYEGNFINENIFGNGIIFYKNGQKKLKGNFESSDNIFKGKLLQS